MLRRPRPTSGPRLVLAAVLGGLALAACGDNAIAPVTLSAGDLRVKVTAQPARIEVGTADAPGDAIDHLVWATRDGADVAAGDPPHAMSGFRAADAAVQMLEGSFKIVDATAADAPWTSVDTFDSLAIDDGGDAVTFTLRAGDGDVGTGRVHLDAAGHVEIELHFTDGDRASLAAQCGADEHFLGLGGQSWDVDHHGQTVPLWVQEDGIGKSGDPDDHYEPTWFLSGRRHSTHSPMPMLVSSAGYALAVATDARAVFALCSEAPDVARYETWTPDLDLHLFVGGDLPRSIDALTAWVGRPAPPPTTVFAPWMDAIFGSANVEAVAAAARADGIAASVIWTEDWRGGADSGTGYALTENWQVDPTLYPDLPQLASDLHGDGFQFLTYNNTFTDSTADIYQAAIDGGYTLHHADATPYLFMGVKFDDSSMIDLSNPAAVAWTKSEYRMGLDAGADGWMADYGEWQPTDATLVMGDALATHNRYAREWAHLNHDLAGERAAAGAPFLYFMRSAWLGSQPLVQVMWLGDQQTDFSLGDGFPSVIPAAIGLGVTGFPYVGSDIGGYMSETTVPTTKELWWRWVALGALSPVMRTHHGRSAKMNWSWQSDPETTALFRRWTRFHMQLVPYLEALSADFQAHGAPLVRPIAFTYPDAGDWAWTTTDEYLLGDVLVAPVVTENATSRSVSLPPGTFYPLLGGAAVAGGGVIQVDAPLGEIPAFVPAGTVIPAWPDGIDTVIAAPSLPTARTAIDHGDDRELWLWPAPTGDAAVRTRCEADGATCYAYTPRDEAQGAPTAATWNGAPVALVREGTGVVATVTGAGTLAWTGGGQIAATGGAVGRSLRIVLRIP